MIHPRTLSTLLIAVLALPIGGLPGAAQTAFGLRGYLATVTVLTYDDPAAPLFISRSAEAFVTDGLEFTLGREGRSGIDTVPVTIDIANDVLEFSYSVAEGPGSFSLARFNGYELRFSPCLMIEEAQVVDAKALTGGTVTAAGGPGWLSVNVAGLAYSRDSTIRVAVRTAPCPSS